jgi:hypothetical protein
VSTLQSESGPMSKGGFGFATEADADSFTIDTQYYVCTELNFAEADPHFGATGVGGVGAQRGATECPYTSSLQHYPSSRKR